MSSENVFVLKVEKDVAVVTFDVVGDVMNTWTDAAFKSFTNVLDALEKEASRLKGVILISGKPETFLAGMNLKVVEETEDEEKMRGITDLFHSSFNRLAALKIPTIAAINGHCLGGGLELTLACTARIAKESKTTVIGLPEVNVGLIPGAGGTQRLPRLIGYPAIELILKGSMLPAAKAYELGIIDALVPADGDLLGAAKALLSDILSGKANLRRPVHDFSQIDTVMAEAKKGVLKATKGREIPAPMTALRSLREGLKLPLDQALENEKKLGLALGMVKETKGTINTFFLKTMTDKPKTMMTKGFEPKPLKKAAVLGFGTMGRGITIDILRNMQIPVVVKDVPEAEEPGKAFVQKILSGMAEKKQIKVPVDDLMNRLIFTTEYTDDFKDVDIVIEAVFEDIQVKEQVYAELSKVIADDCIVASNTSSLSVNAMAPYITNPARFGGIHFFSPVWLMQLVEIVRSDKTSQATIDNLLHFAASIKKRPIVCKDNSGFVVNALLFPYLLNALQFIEEGNSIEKLDKAMMEFGLPVGPIRLCDEVGIDIPYKVLVLGMGIEQPTLTNLIGDGRLGLKKSGKGFFLKDGSVDPAVLPLIAKREPRERSNEEIQMGVLEAMITVGKDLLDRHIVDDPRMIDVGMIWGTGYPGDKGGPMKWADLTGVSEKLFGSKFYTK